VPLIIKADVLGTIEAIQHELKKIKNDRVIIKVIFTGAGNISENDIQIAGGDINTLITGFNVKINENAKNVIEKTGVTIGTFNIIYKLTEWLEKEIQKRTPKIKVEKIIGKAKILRVFSRTKDKQVVGGKVLEGSISLGAQVKISRRDVEIGIGTIKSLQSQKIEAKEVKEGDEFGTMIESKKEIAQGDTIEAFIIVEE